MNPVLPAHDTTAETVKLAYAELKALDPLYDLLSEIDLVVQVRHAPGTVPPKIVVKDDRGGDLDPLLKRWVE